MCNLFEDHVTSRPNVSMANMQDSFTTSCSLVILHGHKSPVQRCYGFMIITRLMPFRKWFNCDAITCSLEENNKKWCPLWAFYVWSLKCFQEKRASLNAISATIFAFELCIMDNIFECWLLNYTLIKGLYRSTFVTGDFVSCIFPCDDKPAFINSDASLCLISIINYISACRPEWKKKKCLNTCRACHDLPSEHFCLWAQGH